MEHSKLCKWCGPFNNFMSTLPDRFTYRIQYPEDWNKIVDFASLVEKQGALKGESGKPVKTVKKVLRGIDKYKQSQAYGYIFDMAPLPRDLAPYADSPVPPPEDIAAVYIDTNGKIDEIYYGNLVRRNPYRYEGGQEKWNKYIEQLRDYKKEHWGKVKIIWQNPDISPVAAKLEVARGRIAVIHSGNRFIDPKTGKLIRRKNHIRRETPLTFDLMNNPPTEYYFDGLHKHTTPLDPEVIFREVFAGKMRISMQSCVAYHSSPDPEIKLGNNHYGAVPSSSSDGDEIKIINNI